MEKMTYETGPNESIISIYANSESTEVACRKLISYLSDNKFDNQIQDDSNTLAQLYDLSIRYLDKDYESERQQIETQIESMLENL